MTTFPGSPRLLKGGIVLVNADTGKIIRSITFQYNPSSLSRTLEGQMAGQEGNRLFPPRFAGPPVETYTIEAEIDASDQLEFPDNNEQVVKNGIAPHLAALETIVYPESADLIVSEALSIGGILSIVAPEAPLVLFVWNQSRVVPVRVTQFSVTEEAFDPLLNPIRAKINLGMRVLNVNDLGFAHRGGGIYMTYQQRLERLAALNVLGNAAGMGIMGSSL
jgi:hypothetical protein